VALVQAQIAKNPNSPDWRLLLARTLARSGETKAAIAEYQKLITVQPLEAHLALGELSLQNGDVSRAVEQLKMALQIAPRNKLAASSLAVALDRAGNSSEAIATYRTALALDPDNPALKNNFADLLVRSNGNVDEAFTYARSALDRVPNQPEFSDTLGMIWLRRRNIPEALRIFRTLAEQHPHEAAYRYHLGLAYLAAGQKNEAKAQLQAALVAGLDNQSAMEVKTLLASL
jgi:Flp pilus assembly protein TadD